MKQRKSLAKRIDNSVGSFHRTVTGPFGRKNRKNRRSPYLSEQMGDVQIPLTLADPHGSPWINFPGDVVDNLRQMITRVSSTNPFPDRLSVIAALPDEGVTYTARAIATVLANDLAAKVCLVDLNWWNPPVPRITSHQNGGLVSVVTGKARLDEVFVSTSAPNLTIIPAGRLPRRDRPVMARSHVLASAIDVLGDYFDHLILDIPAIRATNDAIPLASLSNACCMVIQQGVTPSESVRLALDEVRHLNLIGTVMNQVEVKTPRAILRFVPQD